MSLITAANSSCLFGEDMKKEDISLNVLSCFFSLKCHRNVQWQDSGSVHCSVYILLLALLSDKCLRTSCSRGCTSCSIISLSSAIFYIYTTFGPPQGLMLLQLHLSSVPNVQIQEILHVCYKYHRQIKLICKAIQYSKCQLFHRRESRRKVHALGFH